MLPFLVNVITQKLIPSPPNYHSTCYLIRFWVNPAVKVFKMMKISKLFYVKVPVCVGHSACLEGQMITSKFGILTDSVSSLHWVDFIIRSWPAESWTIEFG